MYNMKYAVFLLLPLLLLSCQAQTGGETEAVSGKDDNWVELFNGENLDGWTPKFAGSPLGLNYKNTFSVKDGMIQASYDEYETFNGEFGHLFYEKPFSNYILHVEYRFVGDQVTDGPGWAFRNSGAMLHCQDPETMEVDQDFPICIEAQFLGGPNDGTTRPTGNLCTPTTNVYLADTLTTTHCIESTSPTFDGDQWVNIDMIVYGDSLVHHVVEGDTVITYTNLQYGEGGTLPNEGDPISSGYISLQAESHPVHFRRVAIKELK
ncbi:MAG TPA: DUF1080 domain-containing protein [Saprospiraceae bacterium]|nr:DUF1080 domain-containing protein [Saprospiraceae bacterium]